MYRPILVALAALVLTALIACETDQAEVLYPRCHPVLVGPLAPEAGVPGDEVALSGYLMTVQVTTLDPYQDVLVTFGPQQATLSEIGPLVDGPWEGSETGACDACDACISDSAEGCIGCEAPCSACTQTVVVIAPEGVGTVPVELANARGRSNALSFSYPEATQTPTGTNLPSPTETTTEAPTESPTP